LEGTLETFRSLRGWATWVAFVQWRLAASANLATGCFRAGVDWSAANFAAKKPREEKAANKQNPIPDSQCYNWQRLGLVSRRTAA